MSHEHSIVSIAIAVVVSTYRRERAIGGVHAGALHRCGLCTFGAIANY
jgi:hypothetical protein